MLLSAPLPLPTRWQRHSTWHRTALPRNTIPAHSLARKLYVLNHWSTQIYKNISASPICSQGDMRNENFCSRRHGRDCVQTCIFCICPRLYVQRTHYVRRHPFLQLIPDRLQDELVYSPAISAKINFRSHKSSVFYYRELGLVTNRFAWDVILTWKKPPLILVGLFFANRESSQVTLYIQSLPVPLKVPVKFLITTNTGA